MKGLKKAKTPEEIAKEKGVPLENVIRQLQMGIDVEKEHTTDKDIAKHIALQHLEELPTKYYSMLKKMEKAAMNEDLRNWFNPKHPDGGWKRINSKGEAVGPCARGSSSEPKPKCMSNKKRKQLSKKRRSCAVRAKRKHDPVADRAGKGGKPVNVSNFGKGRISEAMEYLAEKNVPTNPELWSKAKSLARQKFDVYPCVTMDSLAITRNGPESYHNLVIGDEILTYNIQNDELEWKPILNLHHFDDAPIVEMGKATGFKIKCTPNHKWVVKSGSDYQNTGLVETKDINKHMQLVCCSELNNCSDLILENWSKKNSWTEKVLSMSKEQREIFLASAIVYDAHDQGISTKIEKRHTFGFAQKNEDHFYAAILAASLNGYHVSFSDKYPEMKAATIIRNKKTHNTQNLIIEDAGTEEVWCPETENNTWVMIQNGFVTITGNSAYANGWAAKWYKSKGGGWKTKKKHKKKVNEAVSFGIYDRKNRRFVQSNDPNVPGPVSYTRTSDAKANISTQPNKDDLMVKMIGAGEQDVASSSQSGLIIPAADLQSSDVSILSESLNFFRRMQYKKLLGEDHAAIESGEMIDDEGEMARNQLDTIQHAIERLRDKIKGKKQQLPAWVQSKITKATDGIDTVADYMSSDSEEELNENFVYDHGIKGYRAHNPNTDPPVRRISDNAPVVELGGKSKKQVLRGRSVVRALQDITTPRTGLKGLIQKIKGVFVKEDLQGNKESYADYQARLQGHVGAGRFDQLADHHDKVHAAIGFLKSLEPQYKKALPLVIRAMGGGGSQHARGMVVTGVSGMKLTGRPTGAGGHAASHKRDVSNHIKDITGLHRSFYASLRPDHYHTLTSIFGDMFTEKGKQRLEEAKKPYKGFVKGKNHPEGGLSRSEARRQGIHAGIETKREAQKKGGFGKLSGKTQKRRKSFCSRMCGMKKRRTSAKTARDPKSKINAALRVWGCRCESYNPTCDVCEYEKQLLMHEEVVNRTNRGTMSKSEIKERDRKAKGIKPQPIKGDTDEESKHRIATYIVLRARGGRKTKKKAKK